MFMFDTEQATRKVPADQGRAGKPSFATGVTFLARLTNCSTPSVHTPRLTTAAATIAVATVLESTPSASPSEAIAAGTPN
jgi:hypothetical protein